MPSTSIICGSLLVLLGLVGYGYALTTEYASKTALIPAAIGILLLIFGLIAQRKENLRKHLMHAAVVVALIGFLAPAYRLVSTFREITFSLSNVSQVLLAVICLAFVIISVKSFINARTNG